DEVLVDLGRDALGQLEHHRVREAERHVQLLPGDFRAVTDAVDLELALEPVGDALDHVGDHGAHHAVLRAVLAAVVSALDVDLRAAVLDGTAARDVALELALRPLDRHVAVLDGDGDALRDGDRLSSYAGHGYHTSQRSSPPRPALRASRSVMTPLDVVT